MLNEDEGRFEQSRIFLVSTLAACYDHSARSALSHAETQHFPADEGGVGRAENLIAAVMWGEGSFPRPHRGPPTWFWWPGVIWWGGAGLGGEAAKGFPWCLIT